jgi:FkbM family methyltransferase
MKFPPLPHLDLDGAEFDFGYARSLDMYQYVSGDSWSYEPDVLAALLCLLGEHPRCRFINIGANIGYFPVIAKKLFGDRLDVYAYEPMPELLARLDRAQQRNGIEFTTSGAALADFEGTAPFHLSARSDTSNSLNPNFRPAKNVIDVRVTTLDAEFPAQRIRDRLRRDRHEADGPTVMLVDTESTEPAVLRGGLEFIARVRPAIICEVLAGRTENDLSDIIDQIDYHAYALTDEGPERRTEVVGDRSYQHRDWVFLPREAPAPSIECFAATMAALDAAPA